MSEHISRGTSRSTALVPQEPQSSFLKPAVYIRLLDEEECSQPDVIKMIQNSKYEIDEIYGIFDHAGARVGAGADRSLAAECAAESGYQPQLWLI